MAASRRSWVLRIASDPVCYLWTGHGLLPTPGDAVDPSGATWQGAAGLVGVPSLKALVNGIADRAEFTLSGVTAETLRLATDDAPTVRLAEVRLGYVQFDETWQLSGGISWEWVGVADALRISSQYSADKRSRSIVLMVGSADTFRANPRLTYWTDAAQRLRSPSDAFCDHVASISLSVTRRFGPK